VDPDIILKEIKDETWDDDNEDGLKKKIASYKEKLSELFPGGHVVFSSLDAVSFEPEAADIALYNAKKLETIKNGKKELVRIFNRIPELYAGLPVVDLPFEEIIKRGESHYLEYKESMIHGADSTPGPTMKSVAAFLNSDGGVLVIGMSDNKKAVGINRDYKQLDNYKPKSWGPDSGFQKNTDGFENCFITLLMEYGFSARIIKEFIAGGIKFHKINDKDICAIKIKQSDEPVVINMRDRYMFFVREGNSTRSLDVKETVDYVLKRYANSKASG